MDNTPIKELEKKRTEIVQEIRRIRLLIRRIEQYRIRVLKSGAER